MAKVVIADDHAIVRAGLRALIHNETGLELIAEAAGGYEAIELVEKNKPDVLVLDISMPDLDGILVTRKLIPNFPELRILILTLHEDEALVREALKAGASGYILKRAAESELVTAIQVILRGDMYVDSSMLRSLLGEPKPVAAQQTIPSESLTPRESEILKLIVEGFTNRQIGEHLNISIRTVEGHRANITDKLGLHSRLDMVRYARQHGMID